MSKDAISLIGLITLFLIIVICGPLAIIWGLNTLFPVLSIPYTFWSWLAVWAVQGVLRAPVSFK